MKIKCKKCEKQKESYEFYKNIKKSNGLESHCKSCVLVRKAKKYEVLAKTKKRTKLLRSHSKINVLNVEECTFNEVLINRPINCEIYEPLKELVSGVLCYQNMERS